MSNISKQNIIRYNLLVLINIFEISDIHNEQCQVLGLQKKYTFLYLKDIIYLE